MTLADFTYWCPALEQQSSLLVTLPQEIRAPLPVVYLLHGLSDNHAGWQRSTNVERYAERHQVMVVMPDGGRSCPRARNAARAVSRARRWAVTAR